MCACRCVTSGRPSTRSSGLTLSSFTLTPNTCCVSTAWECCAVTPATSSTLPDTRYTTTHNHTQPHTTTHATSAQFKLHHSEDVIETNRRHSSHVTLCLCLCRRRMCSAVTSAVCTSCTPESEQNTTCCTTEPTSDLHSSPDSNLEPRYTTDPQQTNRMNGTLQDEQPFHVLTLWDNKPVQWQWQHVCLQVTVRTYSVVEGSENEEALKKRAPLKVRLSGSISASLLFMWLNELQNFWFPSGCILLPHVWISSCFSSSMMQVVDVDPPPPKPEAPRRKPVESLGPLLSSLDQQRYGTTPAPHLPLTCPPPAPHLSPTCRVSMTEAVTVTDFLLLHLQHLSFTSLRLWSYVCRF